MHLLGLQRVLPRSNYRSLTESLPMMRAVKDTNELTLAAAGRRQTPPTARSCNGGSLGRRETDIAADLADLQRESDMSRSTSPSSDPVRMVPAPTMRPGIG